MRSMYMELSEDSGNREDAIWELIMGWTSGEGYPICTSSSVLLGFN